MSYVRARQRSLKAAEENETVCVIEVLMRQTSVSGINTEWFLSAI